jgi:hypothetical protein
VSPGRRMPPPLPLPRHHRQWPHFQIINASWKLLGNIMGHILPPIIAAIPIFYIVLINTIYMDICPLYLMAGCGYNDSEILRKLNSGMGSVSIS